MKTRIMRQIISLGLMVVLFLTGCQITPSPAEVTIHDIQGCAHTSPMLGKGVTGVRGIVTLKTENGFVMQSPLPDDQACSSEAIFVHTGNYSSTVTGDAVVVEGRVAEFSPGTPAQMNLSQTEISEAKVKVISAGNILPKATLLGKYGYPFPAEVIEDDRMTKFDPEKDGLDYFESMEWMRVELPQLVVVGPRNAYDEIVVAEVNQGMTEGKRENYAKVAAETDLHPERMMIELPGNWSRSVNVGDQIEKGVIGILEYSYGNYKVHPTTEVNLEKFSGVSTQSENNSDGLRIATYNLNNFSQYSIAGKYEKVAKQISRDLNSPDLLICQEVMDDSGAMDDGEVSAQNNLELLVEAIAGAGGGEYRYFDFPPENNQSGGVDGGNIRTAFLLKSTSVLKLSSAIGNQAVNLEVQRTEDGRLAFSPNPGRFGLSQEAFANSRRPIAGVFDYQGTQIVVVGLHFVSRGMDSPLYGRQQPIDQPEFAKRLAEARNVNSWVKDISRQAPEAIIIVAGDLNDGYEGEVVKALQDGLLVDSAEKVEDGSRFSLIYEGLAVLYDHIMVSANASINQVQILHLNSLFDENSQTSDHDPVLIKLNIQ